MAQISIGDVTGSEELDIADDTLAGTHKLKSLFAPVDHVKAELPKMVANTGFKSAAFSAVFDDAKIPLGGDDLEVKAGVNSSLTLAGAAGGPLFGHDDYDPVEIAAGDSWLSFQLGTVWGGGVNVPLPNGFGVCFAASTAPSFFSHHFIAKPDAAAQTLKQAVIETLDSFKVADSAEAVLSIPENEIWTTDLAGTIKVGGSWALPIAVNQLSLASANLPFNQKVAVAPALTVKVSGDIAVTSGFGVRVRRTSATSIRLGLFKKHGSQFDACLIAGAGVAAKVGGTDLIDAFFTAVAPGAGKGGLSAADYAKIQPVLNDSINRCLSISLNAACSAAGSDEAALVYEIDTAANGMAAAAAIDSALKGDWTPLSQLENARKIRNVVIDTVEGKFSLTVNILGLYNYRSVDDFLQTLRVLHNDEDGSVTLTDSITATQISTASTPLAADGDKLRAALYRSFVATATYKALLAGIGVAATFGAKQDFFQYRDQLGYRSALKQLNVGEALGVMPAAVKAGLPAIGAPVRHARFVASSAYDNIDVLRFFFSDAQALAPRLLSDLTRIGRQILGSLLDPQDPVDNERIAALESAAQWAAMDKDPAQIKPPFYSDWYDITMWATAVSQVGPPLAAAIEFGRSVGGDPSASPEFMQKRSALAHALDGVAHNLKAAFEPGLPICLMTALCADAPRGGTTTFQAEWNGKTIFGWRSSASSIPAQTLPAAVSM